MAFTDKQRGVLKGISIALLVTLAALVGSAALSPQALIPTGDVGGRLRYVLGWDLIPVFCLLIAIGTLARKRFFTPEDIDGSGLTAGSEAAKIHQAVLQNTLEQVVLATGVHTAAALLLPLEWLPCVAVSAILFGIGRILFWHAYRGGAASRALGFGLTFYPTVALFLMVLGVIL